MKFAALLALALVACGDDSNSSATSLEGTIECGSPATQCTTGQVCLHFTAGIDAGTSPGDSYECKTVPGSCGIMDRDGTCASCVSALAPTRISAYSVSGRTVNCLGQ